ncbi:MAG: hypothetical protein IK151_05615 [Erysipelotrichaceae bacterium]|nr:hypothetical protein [Erysipelotrichaceae bacterium]
MERLFEKIKKQSKGSSLINLFLIPFLTAMMIITSIPVNVSAAEYQTLTYDYDDKYKVILTYDEASSIPEGSTLHVEEYADNDNEYLNKTKELLEWEESDFNVYSLLDVYIEDKDGNRVIPHDKVKIKIQTIEPEDNDEEIEEIIDQTKLVILGEDNDNVIVNNQGDNVVVKEDTNFSITFKNENEESEASFPIVAVAQVVREKIIKASDGNNYSIKVSYDANAGIPLDAELRVEEVSSDGYLEYGLDSLNVPNTSVSFAYAFDISIVDAYGNECEPEGSVKVSIELLNEEFNDDLNIGVLHIADDKSELINHEINEGTVEFDTNGFSVYMIVGYNTDFYYVDCEGETWKISATYSADSDIPEDIQLVVRELESNECEEYLDDAARALGVSDNEVKIAKAFDIHLEKDGIEYHNTEDEFEVKIQLSDIDLSEMQILHFSDDSNDAEMVEATSDEDSLSFKTDGFSVYAIVKTTIVTTIEASDGNTYKITAEYDSDSGLPEDTRLEVIEISSDSDEFEQYIDATAEKLNKNAEEFKFAKVFDISIVDNNTGKKYHPNENVKVSIELLKEEIDEEETEVSVVHFTDSSDAEDLYDYAEIISNSIVDGKVEFENDDFSVYAIVSYTVDFHWGDYTYSIAGEDSILLSELLEKLGITEVTVEDIEDVSFSDTSLITVEKTENDWLLTSLEAFATEQTLTLVLKNGKNVSIKVTDEQLPKEITITADSASKPWDGTELTKNSYTYTDLLPGDSIESVTITGSQTASGISENVPSDAKIVNSNGDDVTGNYNIIYVNGTLEVIGTKIKITSNTASKTYDGTPLTDNGYTVVGELNDNSHTISVNVTGSQTNAGSSDNTFDVTILDGNSDSVTAQYSIECVYGTLTVDPISVTLSANSGTRKVNESGDPINLGYTCSVEGLTFDGVSVTSASTVGMHDVKFYGVTLGETKDTTGNYVVTKTNDGLLIIEGNTPFVTKSLTDFNINLAYYKIEINQGGDIINDGNYYVIKDTFSSNQSINYGSIRITCDPVVDNNVTYDYSGYTGTFNIPDGTHVTITYYTRVQGDTDQEIDVNNTVELGKMIESSFVSAFSTTVTETVKIKPDINGTGGVYTIGLYVYANGHMEQGLSGASFRLLDSNKQPMTYLAGDKAGEEITFTTGSGGVDGYVLIGLDEETDGVSIHKNTPYYLEMITAPYTFDGENYIYYQKDNTYYSFLVTDDPDYSYGGIYSYFDGDVLKVRCYPETGGVNVTKRFSGNYNLTNEQKNAITFKLQKYNAGEWEDVEEHAYGEFSYGSLNFDIKGSELEDSEVYRVVEVNGLPEELEGTIDLNTTYSISYQRNGEPVEIPWNEFLVNPDDAIQFSYNLSFTNEYIDHKLTIGKLDELTGTMLSGAVFKVYKALDESNEITSYVTGNDGTFDIKKGDTNKYQTDTLYYVQEVTAPANYILSDQKVFFYFSNNSTAVPSGLPEGETATDLTTRYNSVIVADRKETTTIPVTVTWGLNGLDEWPNNVSSVIIGLYQSTNGSEPTKVLDNNNPKTLTLTKTQYYDRTTFVNLPAQDTSGNRITYSIKEEAIYDSENNNIITSYAQTNSISSPGWYIVNNQEAVSVVVRKEWYQIDGQLISDTSGKESVTFDLYQLTTDFTGDDLDRSEVSEVLGDATPIKTGLVLSSSNGWTQEIDSLKKTDGTNNYYYLALETVPDNQEDSYTIADEAGENRTITIKNTQTPSTVTIKAKDLNKKYLENDPAYEFSASVMEDGSTVNITGSDSEFTATVSNSGSVTAEIEFTVTRVGGENVGTYTITPSSTTLPSNYRVLFETGTLTISQAEVTVTAGAEKRYGSETPALAKVTGLPDGVDESAISYSASWEENEDVGEYPITLTGETDQGNYKVTYVNGYMVITPAPVIVSANNASKIYGDDDPEFSADISGLLNDDNPTVISYQITRDIGEDVGSYALVPDGDTIQGNYSVTYSNGEFTITSAPLTVKVGNSEKTYGDGDPEWIIIYDGLQGDDDGDTLISYNVNREEGEDVGEYSVTLTGEADQGNYSVSFVDGTLTIIRAELSVKADNIVKALGVAEDPLLTATITGWTNDDNQNTSISNVDENTVTWTYTRNDKTILSFTLQRSAGEEEGEYEIIASGAQEQHNYNVYYENGSFSILSMFNVDVSQATVDPVGSDTEQTYSYTANVELATTGIGGSYNENGFVDGSMSFNLPDTSSENPNTKTLTIPAGAKLTVKQNNEHSNYSTSILLDNNDYSSENNTCVIDGVDDFYAIKFVHSRISMNVIAMITDDTPQLVNGSSGYIGIPEGEETIDSSFVSNYKARVGYTLPSDKYYVFTKATIDNDEVQAIRYDSENSKWQYKRNGTYHDVPDGKQLTLLYKSAYICKIGNTQFYTLNDAMDYVANTSNRTATIEMLLDDYPMPSTDKVVIPVGYDITITTARNLSGKFTISRAYDFTSGHMFANNGGSLKFDNIILDGKNVSASDAMILNNNAKIADETYTGILIISEDTVLKNSDGNNGGAIYISNGEVTVNGEISNNNAEQGGAIYVNGGTVTIEGEDSIIKNNTAAKGGAIFVANGALNINNTSINNNSALYGGAVFTTGGTTTLNNLQITENNATYGGVISMTAGTVTIDGENTDINNNTASEGGVVYIEGGTINISAGTIQNNTASISGGFIYGTNGQITISDGTIKENVAENGNGGAIYYMGSGNVNISGGSFTGNIANNGYGGVLYQSAGTATLSGGTIGKESEENRAINGSAVFVSDGACTFNGVTIKNNIATNGGAVGIENITARLHFSGNTVISENKTETGIKNNVYLNIDSDTIINTAGLGNNANIGIYVSDDYLSTRGDACKSFGEYSNRDAQNLTKFTNDRSNVLKAYYSNYKLIWSTQVYVKVYYISSFNNVFSTNFKAGTTGEQKYSGSFYPTSTENSIYELVSQLYKNLYSSKVPSDSVYAYTFAKDKKNFEQFMTELNWDSPQQKWRYINSSTYDFGNTLCIYYSDPAYISITNNSGYDLEVNDLTVLRNNIIDKNYGYPTVIDYLTQETLIPIRSSSVYNSVKNTIVIPSGGYVKILFPGACESDFTISGKFTGESPKSITYTLNSLGEEDEQETDTLYSESGDLMFTLGGTTLAKGDTFDVLFGNPTPICKVEDANEEHPFTKLKEAIKFITENELRTATIEMLMDYLQPGDDVLIIPEGYNITLTTAAAKGSEEAIGKRYTYSGEDSERATISRDSTNDGAAVIAEAYPDLICETEEDCNSSLTVKYLIFDGKALAKSGNGGAISTRNNKVTISNCDFKGYQASRGGAIFVKWGALIISDSIFANCITRSATGIDKTGGGAIWTTAKELEINRCQFINCSCIAGPTQGGAIFHNIRNDGAVVYDGNSEVFPTNFSIGSITNIENCKFENCYSALASGGTVESDALNVSIKYSSFKGSYTGKSNGNGGAINIYVNDGVNYNNINSSLEIIGCSFEDCSAPNGSSLGGAIRTLTRNTVIKDSTFNNCSAYKGGAICVAKATNSNVSETNFEVYGSTFENCTARAEDGAIYTCASTLIISSCLDINNQERHSLFKNCSAPKYGGVCQNKDSNGSSATIEKSMFENCVSSNSEAGALYTKAKSLSITGIDNTTTFKNCTASTNGGAVYHSGTTEILANVSFEECKSNKNGGGAYLSAGSITISGSSFADCLATNLGGGLYINPTNGNNIANITGCEFSGNVLSALDSCGGSLYIQQNKVKISGGSISNSVAANGGGIYQASGTLYLNENEISNCKANISGGGLYSKGTCYLGDIADANEQTIENCYAATSGGGIYHTNNLYARKVNINKCKASKGGGIYSSAYMDVSATNGSVTISNCQAKNITINDDRTITEADGFISDNLGGGLYKSGNSNLVFKNSDVVIEKCSAYGGGGVYYDTSGTFTLNKAIIQNNSAVNNGGGLYQNSGIIKMSTNDSTIISNVAIENGGGIYKADGNLELLGGVIGGSSEDANIANNGAGLFVADSQSVTIGSVSITHNKATAAGGGISVGGNNTKLYFQNNAVVHNNTMGSEENTVTCNVYLDHDTNGIINTTGTQLGNGSYIGVYCSDEQDPSHGFAGMPFGTYNKTDNLNHFFNDRRPYYYGVQGGTDNQIVWSTFVCKITDSNGKLLYKDADKTMPAIFTLLENGASDVTNSAFGYIRDNRTLYNDDGSCTDDFQIQMLVQEYSQTSTNYAYLKNGRKITLTTASATPDEEGFYYNGDQKHPYATIKKTVATSNMIRNDGGELTLKDIILDAGSDLSVETRPEIYSDKDGGIIQIGENGIVTIGENATLQNSYTTQNGAAVALTNRNATLNLNGGTIKNCVAEKNAGAVYLNATNDVFNYSSGLITNCSGTKGGAVYIENYENAKMNMSGGTITKCNATTSGGAVAVGGSNYSLYFSGSPVITGNTLNNETNCNVQLDHDSVRIITASNLKKGAEIGIYVPGEDVEGSQYSKHGIEGTPFGIWTDIPWQDDGTEKPYSFVNDRNTLLRGSQGNTDDQNIYWAQNFLLTINTNVISDLLADKDVIFNYTLKVDTDKVVGKTFSDYHFNVNRETTLDMKDGDSITIYFPKTILHTEEEKIDYFVVVNYTDEQGNDYHCTIQNNEDEPVSGVLETSGKLGENLSHTPPSGRSYVTYNHYRNTVNMTISKVVTSKEEADKATEFSFIIEFGDTSINKTYSAKDVEGHTIEDGISFVSGKTSFVLTDGNAITIEGLPTDLSYTITEDMSGIENASRIRTKINKDGDEITSRSQTGIVSGNSNIVFTNNFMEIICKITDKNRNLLYYSESNGDLVPAIYDNLSEAFNQVNNGGLRKANGGSVTGFLRIEMVVPEYTTSEMAVLNSGRTVTLSTAKANDEDGYPYRPSGDEDDGVSTIYRGDFTESMIVDNGVLTLDSIVLDGSNDGSITENIADDNGGLIRVYGSAAKLTVSKNATLRNSKTDLNHNGGAIWVGSGASLDMKGIIDNCSAASGGGIFADDGFGTINISGSADDGTGLIANCEAITGNGGAVSALTGSAVNISNESVLAGNSAYKNGGAVYSKANVVLRGSIGTSESGNSARENGGGIYMDSETVFTMYSTSTIDNNTSTNGGGLYTIGVARISGGNLSNNIADGLGGGVYVAEDSELTISSSSTFIDNEAARGGAIYDNGYVLMNNGSLTGNIASEKGGAVFVADDCTFAMSGGSINNGNKSPEGAVSTGLNSVLKFSNNVVVSGNTGSDNSTAMNVYLGYDSNAIIQTTGLGTNANIGVYVADGPEKSIYYQHGIASRNFGTYTGTSINSARLSKFVNDRDNELTGMSGAEIPDSENFYIMWKGKGLRLAVYKYKPDTDISNLEVDSNVYFTLTNIHDENDDSDDVQVWSGKSENDGTVFVPWGSIESKDGNVASFVSGNTYILKETRSNSDNPGTVLPGGYWKLLVGDNNFAIWTTVIPTTDPTERNRTHDIVPADEDHLFVGDTFVVYNDTEPKITFIANGGKFADDSVVHEYNIDFTTMEINHNYTIEEKDPLYGSYVFLKWATWPSPNTPPESGQTIEYKEYGIKGDADSFNITWFRNSDNDDLTLYAIWEQPVCKITDANDRLLYKQDGSPAVYSTLEDAFDAVNNDKAFYYNAEGTSRVYSTILKIKMLKENYTLEEDVTLTRNEYRNITLTSALSSDNDGYPGVYDGTNSNTASVITRGNNFSSSMITNYFNLTLTNIVLDGNSQNGTVANTNGGIVSTAQSSAVLTIGSGAVLRNSVVIKNTDNEKGLGGAVYAIRGSTINITGGTISGNKANNGAGIYLSEGGTLNISGSPSFGGGNNIPLGTGQVITNGGVDYNYARQDIYIEGYAGDEKAVTSLVVNGQLTGDEGSIWVWVEEDPHYKTLEQFARIKSGLSISSDSLKVFRNAKDDSVTDNDTETYLYGTDEGDISGYVYWSGTRGYGRVILRKINGSYSSLSGKVFTIYKGNSTSPYRLKDGTILSSLVSDAAGCIWVGELPYGIYYLEEIEPNKWFYVIVDEKGTSNMAQGYDNREAAKTAALAEKAQRDNS